MKAREIIYHSGDRIVIGNRIKWYDSAEGHCIYGDVNKITEEDGFTFLFVHSVNTGLDYKVFRGNVINIVVWK